MSPGGAIRGKSSIWAQLLCYSSQTPLGESLGLLGCQGKQEQGIV